jgi:hypothetical protein
VDTSGGHIPLTHIIITSCWLSVASPVESDEARGQTTTTTVVVVVVVDGGGGWCREG